MSEHGQADPLRCAAGEPPIAPEASGASFPHAAPGAPPDPALGAQAADAAAAAAVEATTVPPRQIECWRCGKMVEETAGRCPWCAAPVGGPPPAATPARRPRPAVLTLVGAFSALLVINAVMGGLTMLATADDDSPRPILEFTPVGVAHELFWTLVCVVAIVRVPRPAPLPRRSRLARVAAWGLGLPVLALLLLANLCYHQLLVNFIGLQWLQDVKPPPPSAMAIAFGIVSICIQPGVIEELFFRYLAFGTLRGVMGAHSAVLVSSIMFGAAHIGAPLSVPILTLVGLGLGYLRLLSGSLLLPMILHALHNAVVVWLELSQ